MKKICLSIGALLLCSVLMTAQTQRTVQTTVSDVLAQMPAKQKADYDKLLEDLSRSGEEGVLLLVQKLEPVSKDGHIQVDYALNGLSCYVTAPGREDSRRLVATAYGKALERLSDPQTKAFLIRQLQIVGRDESVSTLKKYLSDKTLCAPAAAALVSIKSEQAIAALLEALASGESACRADIVRALADTGSGEAEKALLALSETDDPALEKVVLYALGRCGSEASLKMLSGKARQAGYTMEPTDAVEAYLALIRRLVSNGETKTALKEATALWKNAGKAGQTHTRESALEIILSLRKGEEAKLLQEALKDPDNDYRAAALSFVSGLKTPEVYKELIRSLPKAKPEVKIDILRWLAAEASDADAARIIRELEIKYELPALLVLQNQLESPEYDVVDAAAWMLVKTKDPGSATTLTGLLSSADPQRIALGKNTLSAFSGDISPIVARAIPALPAPGQIAGLEVLAARKSDASSKVVYDLAVSSDAQVKAAALKALKDVVTERDLIRLFGMLQQAPGTDVPALQQAIVSAFRGQSPAEQVRQVEEQMYRASDSKKHLFYPVLAGTGEKNALDLIVAGFTKGSGTTKEAAFDALLNFRGIAAADELFAICQDPSASAYFDRAIDTYIRMVARSGMTGENRLIYLRKAMEIAKTDARKITVLEEIGKTGTFIGLIYAGNYLEEKPLQQAAANAVMNIGLNHKQYTGPEVVRLLTRAAEVLDNPDADYQRKAIRKHLQEMPAGEGFVSLFNGRDLSGWKGLVENPVVRAKMKPAQLAKAQTKADEAMRRDWKVEGGCLVYVGDGFDNLCTDRAYGDFEMYIDWRLDPAGPEADAGIYLRGTPQVQIWDTSRVNVGAQVGSGGLYNNQSNPSRPLRVADNRLGEWNSFYIKMTGDRVTVYLNGQLVTDNVILENFWDRKQPVFPVEQIELQAHGSKVYYRDIYIKELKRTEPYKLSAEEQKEGFRILFDGTHMHEWTGNTKDYVLEDGCIVMHPSRSFGGNLYTKDEFGNFVYRFEFQLTPAANNGVGIRTPMEGDAAYEGMEIQILDCEHPVYKNITPLQHHGSVYGIIPAQRHASKPVGEWNTEEIVADGDHIRVTVNGVVILDGNIRDAVKNGTPDHKEHPGLFNPKGHIGFLGHGSEVKFRNIRIKELK